MEICRKNSWIKLKYSGSKLVIENRGAKRIQYKENKQANKKRKPLTESLHLP